MKRRGLCLVAGMAVLACIGCANPASGKQNELTPSTIVFADGSTVSKMIWDGTYANAVSGDGTGAITYESDTPVTATVEKDTGTVSILAPGTTVITAKKAATSTYGSATASYALTVIGIGSDYLGGVMAYILQPRDLGYDPDTAHGLIVAKTDQSQGVVWAKAAYQNTFVPAPGASAVAVGTGLANTNAIIAQNGQDNTYAAGIARAYDGGGYTDWYLPSHYELLMLYQNRETIKCIGDHPYWSSSDFGQYAYFVWFHPNPNNQANKSDNSLYVRAIRSF